MKSDPILYIFPGIDKIPRFAVTHYIYDIHGRPTDTPLPQQPAIQAKQTKQKNLHCDKNAPAMSVAAHAPVTTKPAAVKPRRGRHNNINKQALAEYFDNIDTADKIAAEKWQQDAVAELEQIDLARRESEQKFAHAAGYAHYAELIADMENKNKMISDKTSLFLATQAYTTRAFLTAHYDMSPAPAITVAEPAVDNNTHPKHSHRTHPTNAYRTEINEFLIDRLMSRIK